MAYIYFTEQVISIDLVSTMVVMSCESSTFSMSASLARITLKHVPWPHIHLGVFAN